MDIAYYIALLALITYALCQSSQKDPSDIVMLLVPQAYVQKGLMILFGLMIVPQLVLNVITAITVHQTRQLTTKKKGWTSLGSKPTILMFSAL